MSGRRKRTLVPWYHVPKPRCITVTIAKTRCTYSASYQTPDGQIQVCKIHADMLILEGVKLKPIRTRTIDLADDNQRTLRSVPFRSAGAAS